MQKQSTKAKMSPLRRLRLERTICLVLLVLMGASSFIDPSTLWR